MGTKRQYKPTKAEQGQIERAIKIAALKNIPEALLVYSNMQLAQAIQSQPSQGSAKQWHS